MLGMLIQAHGIDFTPAHLTKRAEQEVNIPKRNDEELSIRLMSLASKGSAIVYNG